MVPDGIDGEQVGRTIWLHSVISLGLRVGWTWGKLTNRVESKRLMALLHGCHEGWKPEQRKSLWPVVERESSWHVQAIPQGPRRQGQAVVMIHPDDEGDVPWSGWL